VNEIFCFSPQDDVNDYFWSLFVALCRTCGEKAEKAFLIVAHYHGNQQLDSEWVQLARHGSLSDDAKSLCAKWKDKDVPVPDWINWEAVKSQLEQFNQRKWR